MKRMFVGVFNPTKIDVVDQVRIDLNYLRKEWRNLNDVPREFDEAFLRKMHISDAVIKYWKDIGFVPSYCQRYAILEYNRDDFTYSQYRENCLELLPGITQENASIGNALSDYIKAEDNALAWFKTTADGYVYSLYSEYEDGSSEILLVSTEWRTIMARLQGEAAEYQPDEFVVERYAYAKEGNALNIDFQDSRGRVYLSNDGKIRKFCDIDKYQYDAMDALPLVSPYIIMPLPFKEKDFVTWHDDGTTYYGMVYWMCTQEPPDKEDNIHKDFSDVLLNVQMPYEKDGKIYIDYDHIYPYNLDYAKLNEDSEEYRLLSCVKSEWDKNGAPVWEPIKPSPKR